MLVTSRNQAWSHSAEPLEVDVFTRDESVDAPQRRVPEPGPGGRGRGWPTPSVTCRSRSSRPARGWRRPACPVDAYVEQLAEQATRVLALNQPADYPTPVVATWNISFDRLRSGRPAAVRLLQLCAFLLARADLDDLLYSEEMIDALLPYDDALSEKLMLGRVIRDIGRFALAKVDQGSNSIQIHRLVQAVIRSQMTEEEQDEARHEVHEILVGRPARDAATPTTRRTGRGTT